MLTHLEAQARIGCYQLAQPFLHRNVLGQHGPSLISSLSLSVACSTLHEAKDVASSTTMRYYLPSVLSGSKEGSINVALLSEVP